VLEGTLNTAQSNPVSKHRLFMHNLLFIDHFTVSGDMHRC